MPRGRLAGLVRVGLMAPEHKGRGGETEAYGMCTALGTGGLATPPLATGRPSVPLPSPFPYPGSHAARSALPLRLQGNTHDSLQEMGKRLAVEMAEVLAPFARSTRRPLRKITLVGACRGARRGRPQPQGARGVAPRAESHG